MRFCAGRQIRQLMNDEQFQASMTLVENGTLLSLKEMTRSMFLGNEKDPNYRSMLTIFENFSAEWV